MLLFFCRFLKIRSRFFLVRTIATKCYASIFSRVLPVREDLTALPYGTFHGVHSSYYSTNANYTTLGLHQKQMTKKNVKHSHPADLLICKFSCIMRYTINEFHWSAFPTNPIPNIWTSNVSTHRRTFGWYW